MAKVIRKIEFTGKNLNDIFYLPCVESIAKIRGHQFVMLFITMTNAPGQSVAGIGDFIVEYDNGKWGVEMGK